MPDTNLSLKLPIVIVPLERDFDFKPSTSIEEGLQKFADWYVDYYDVK